MGQRAVPRLGGLVGVDSFVQMKPGRGREINRSKRVQNELALLSFCGSEKSNEAQYRLPPYV